MLISITLGIAEHLNFKSQTMNCWDMDQENYSKNTRTAPKILTLIKLVVSVVVIGPLAQLFLLGDQPTHRGKNVSMFLFLQP